MEAPLRPSTLMSGLALLAGLGPAGAAGAWTAATRAALDSAGAVRFVDREAGEGGAREGVTRFELTLAYRDSYRYTIERRGGLRRVALTPSVQAEVRVRHVLELPVVPGDTSARAVRLADHARDHVAISSDERVRLLLVRLVGRLGTLTRDLPAGTAVTDSLLQGMVDEAVARRREAVRALVQAGYDELDSLTRNGAEPLPDRRAFFERLYAPATLESRSFPYREALAGLEAEPAWRAARRFGAE